MITSHAAPPSHPRHRAAVPSPSKIATRSLVYVAFPLAACGYACIYTLALRGASVSVVHALFWACTATVLGAVVLLVRAGCTDIEAALASALLGAVFYLPKYFRSPLFFNFHDEYAHWYATQQLLTGHGLSVQNPDNLVVQFYPGLTALTSAVSSMTGLSVYAAGNLVAAWAHIVSCLAIYGLCRQLGSRPAVSLCAVLLFAANPAFFYFDAQFAYETLAVAFFATALLGATAIASPDRDSSWADVLLLAVVVGALIMTHHATAYVLAVTLVLLASSSFVLRNRAGLSARACRQLAVLAGFSVAATAAWLLTVARYTFSYLGPLISTEIDGIRDLFATAGHSSRQLFATAVIPTYEIVGSYLAVVVLLGLYVWILATLRHRDIRHDPRHWTLMLLAGAYFASLPAVYALNAPTAKRPWVFAFIGLAAVGAPAVHRALTSARLLIWLACSSLMVILYIGGVVTMSGEDIRFPGAYEAGSDTLAATPDVISAAYWLDSQHGSGNDIVADETDAQIFGSYGRQHPQTYEYFAYKPWNVVFPAVLNATVYDELRSDHARFIIIDRRIATQPPLPQGYYFNSQEPDGNTGKRPFGLRSLDKFRLGPFEEIYNNGNVIIWQYLKWVGPVPASDKSAK
jgi:hypothetical protein